MKARIAQVISLRTLSTVDWTTYLDDVPVPAALGTDHGANITISGGKIFPGKKHYQDIVGWHDSVLYDEPAMRKKVTVRAIVTDDVEDMLVHFWVWDVDDPHVGDPDDSLAIDEEDDADHDGDWDDNYGGDNFGGAGSLSPTSAYTDVCGIAEVTFTVGMRPGDNYKATASTNLTRLGGVDQAKIDGRVTPFPDNVEKSPVLTVWRKLHIEFDTMDAPPANEPFGIVTGTSEKIETDAITAQVSGGLPNWPSGVSETVIGEVMTGTNYGYSLNGGVLNPDGTTASNSVDYVGLTTFEGFGNSAHVCSTYCDYTWDRIDNDGDTEVDETDEKYEMTPADPCPPGTNFAINTDDFKWGDTTVPLPSTSLAVPSTSTVISGMNGYYDDAYIEVEEQIEGNDVPGFDWFRNTTKHLATVDRPGGADYWTACVGWAYEMHQKVAKVCPGFITCNDHYTWTGDDDPEGEGCQAGTLVGTVMGYTDGIGGDRCMIYCESIRDKDDNYGKTVTHEAGHMLGLQHATYTIFSGFGFTSDNWGIMGWKRNIGELGCNYDWKVIRETHTDPDRFSYNNIRYLRENATD